MKKYKIKAYSLADNSWILYRREWLIFWVCIGCFGKKHAASLCDWLNSGREEGTYPPYEKEDVKDPHGTARPTKTMKLKTNIRIATALAVACSALFSVVAGPGTNQTYTVKTPGWETTNAVQVIPNHEKKFPPCTLIRYVENGRTNEFHAWACPVAVTTNKPSPR